MYKNKKILCFIPARKGSKRVPFKNGKLLDGIPLFQYSVDVAKNSSYVDDIIVSTDSEEILEKAHKLGCIKNELRPDYLSDDKARIIDSMLYELSLLEDHYDAIILLQPTFPYRTVDLLDSAIKKYFEKETSLITVVKSKEQPLFIRRIVNDKLEKILCDSSDVRSQCFEEFYRIIGCIYINNVKLITKETVLNENEIPLIIDDSFDIDIDTPEDFERAERKIKGE